MEGSYTLDICWRPRMGSFKGEGLEVSEYRRDSFLFFLQNSSYRDHRKTKMSPTSDHVCSQICVSTNVIFQPPLRSTSMHPQTDTYLSSPHVCPLHISSREVPLRVVCTVISFAFFCTERCTSVHMPLPSLHHQAAGTVYAETRITIPLHTEGQTPFGLAVGSLFPSCTYCF